MKKILSIIDSANYIAGTPYNRQFQLTLSRLYDTSYIELSSLSNKGISSIVAGFDEIICSLRLRTLVANLEIIKKFVGDFPITVYDQDPWESFNSEGPWNGSYFKILEVLNVKKFVNTTKFWSNFCNDRNLPADSITMGILPEDCSYGIPWKDRVHNCIFMGTVKSHRKIFFDNLESMGLHIEMLPRQPHNEFLKTVGKSRVFLHNVNDPPFSIEGEKWNMFHGYPWVKDIEIAGNGCYTITNKRGSMEEYYVDKIPLIRTFENENEIPSIVDSILGLSHKDAEKEIAESVDFIKNIDYWKSSISRVIG